MTYISISHKIYGEMSHIANIVWPRYKTLREIDRAYDTTSYSTISRLSIWCTGTTGGIVWLKLASAYRVASII